VNVLVVDDDRAMQRLLADALTQQGFSVTVERDGAWALKAFETKDFDAVVLDLLLPEVDGYEVARRIRQLPRGRSTPIVMISGVYRNELHQKEAVEHHGAFAFLEKPIKLSALFDALRAALPGRYPPPQLPPEPATPVPGASPEGPRAEVLAGDEAREEVSLVERSTRAPDPSSSVRGDFAQKPFPEVLAELHRWKATGALLLRRSTVKKMVFLRHGVPQFVKSNLLSECLGRVMVKERLLSEADCEESLRRMKASRRQQGAVLIEMGVISPNNLAHALNLQQRVKLFEVFSWQGGQYQFSRRDELPPETVNIEMSAAAIIHEGVRRSFDQARVSQALGPVDALYVHPSDDPASALQDLELAEEEQALLRLMDGRRTVKALRAMNVLAPLDADRLIYALRCTGVVELRSQPAEGSPAISFEAVTGLDPARSGPRQLPLALPLDQPGTSGAWSSLDGNAPLPGPEDSEITRPTEYTADLLQNATARSGPSSVPFVEPSGAHSGAGVEERLQRERLAARVAAMRRQDHFAILGLSTSASGEQIRQSYLSLAREFHPDKLAGSASAEIRQLSEEIYNLVSLAHDVLVDPRERERYTRDLAAGNVQREAGEDVGRILAAEGKFQKGEELLRRGALAEAHQAFQEAVALYGDEGEFHAFLGWTRYRIAPEDPRAVEEAIRELETAIKLNPKSDRTYLFAGQIYKATGRADLAEIHFEKAIQANPGSAEALRELSILSWAARLGGGRGQR
jgi:CheY-like chemotaxis protein/tetratricopeptide (TPR) repeat protein